MGTIEVKRSENISESKNMVQKEIKKSTQDTIQNRSQQPPQNLIAKSQMKSHRKEHDVIVLDDEDDHEVIELDKEKKRKKNAVEDKIKKKDEGNSKDLKKE